MLPVAVASVLARQSGRANVEGKLIWNGESDGRKRSPIDRWETVEVLCSEQREVDKHHLGVEIEVQRPVFADGRTGRLSLGVLLRRDERVLRLFCPFGAVAEISAFRELLESLSDARLDAVVGRFRSLCDEHAPPRGAPRRAERPSGRPNDPGVVGYAQVPPAALDLDPEAAKRERRRTRGAKRSREREDW